jgi:putative RecB family exonuclease
MNGLAERMVPLDLIPRTAAPVTVDRPGDPLEYISASRLKSFLTCRLRFYYEKVQGIKKPLSVKAHLGRCVHAALRDYHKSRWIGQCLDTAELFHRFRQEFNDPQEPDALETVSTDEWQRYIGDGERLLQAYLLSGVQPVEEKPLGVEVAVREAVPGIALPLYGIIDFVRPGPVAVDFKTVGSTPNGQVESWLHELQLVTYSLLIEAATGEAIRQCELVFLVRTRQPKVIVETLPGPTVTQRRRFASLADTYQRAVRDEDYYPSPGQHCAWCPFRQECSAWEGVQSCRA